MQRGQHTKPESWHAAGKLFPATNAPDDDEELDLKAFDVLVDEIEQHDDGEHESAIDVENCEVEVVAPASSSGIEEELVEVIVPPAPVPEEPQQADLKLLKKLQGLRIVYGSKPPK